MPDRRPCSLWAETAAATDPPSAEGLPDDADVAIVGAGYTGLWTAVALQRADPALRVCIVERDSVGFGASGRNGGWCSALFPVGLGALAARHGREATIRLQRALIDTVDEVAAFADGDARAVGVDVQFRQGGTLRLARSEAQRSVLRDEVAEARQFGFGADHLRLLDPDELAARCRARDAVAASYSPHCAALHPLRLAQALAATARSLGVRIVEGVEVIEILPGALVTWAGTVHTPVTVLATEAYTTGLPGRRRDVLPMYSMMVGSEPLSATQWDEIGLAGRETFTSTANMIIYGQRTADGRLAFGGRGAPYHFGSRVAPEFDTDERVRAMLRATLAELFPVTARRRASVPLGRPARRAPRLAPARALRPGAWAGVGGWVRRRRRGGGQPRRAHARRSDPRPRHRPHPPADRRAPFTALGARAAAVGRRPRRRGRRRTQRSPRPPRRRLGPPVPLPDLPLTPRAEDFHKQNRADLHDFAYLNQR